MVLLSTPYSSFQYSNFINPNKDMKKHLLIAVAAFVGVMANAQVASAQDINQTTLWTFDQYQDDDVVAADAAINYGGLYIIGHSSDKPATITVKNNSTFKFGDHTYYVNYYVNLPGNGLNGGKATSASAIDQDAVAFNAASAGTTYVAYVPSKADRGIKPFFNGTEVTTAASGSLTASDTKTIAVASFTNSGAGTVAITSSAGSVNIYAVKFVPASETAATKTVTLSKYGVSTFSDTHAWKIPEGLKAYYASAINKSGKNLGIREVTGTIPACTGVILQGSANGEYTLTSTDAGSLERSAGKGIDFTYALRPVIATDGYALKATDLTTNTSKDDNHNYLLADGGDSPIFAPAAAGNIAAGKAYYSTRADKDNYASSGTSASAKGISLVFDNTTGISQIENEKTVNNDAIYNLAGQVVNSNYKGVVIKNGKKYIQK